MTQLVTAAGWLRRNRWGLIAILPALALIVGLRFDTIYDLYWNNKPREPIPVAPDGWVSFAAARFRLTELVEAKDVKGTDGKPFALPGVTVWRAKVAIETSDPDAVRGCNFALEDSTGRIYGSNATELIRARVPVGSCLIDDKATPPVRHESIVHFILPASVQPAAVRVTLATKLPAYARLTPPAAPAAR